MNGSKVAIRYAKAVLQEAGSSAESIFADMKSVAATIDNSKELRSVLGSPVIKIQDKENALLEIFGDISEGSKNLIRVLSANQRIGILGQVAHSYIHLYNESKGVKVAKVTTAVPITEDIEKQVLTKVKEMTGSNTVSIENIVDESIIGGFILRVGDLQYNASIANNLNKLKREFTLN